MKRPTTYCSFCGKGNDEVARVFVAPGPKQPAICNECVMRCVALLQAAAAPDTPTAVSADASAGSTPAKVGAA